MSRFREGGGEIHDVYVDGHLLRGLQHLKDNRPKKALDDFRLASEYPENLSVGRPKNDSRAPQIAYFTGRAYEALGDTEKATAFYKQAANQRGTSRWSETRFYQGLALRELGRPDAAGQIFADLAEVGRKNLVREASVDVFAKFGERQTPEAQQASAHYTLGLAYLGQGHQKAAKAEFTKAVELNTSHVWAKAWLAESDANLPDR